MAVIVIAVALIVGLWHPWARKADQTQSSGAADTVAIGLKLAPTNLDIRNTAGSALDQVLIGNVYEGLVARNSENKVVPARAKAGM